MLGDIDLRKSNAWKAEDRDKIFRAVEATPGGFDALNRLVLQVRGAIAFTLCLLLMTQ
jgi:hypothetical protein